MEQQNAIMKKVSDLVQTIEVCGISEVKIPAQKNPRKQSKSQLKKKEGAKLVMCFKMKKSSKLMKKKDLLENIYQGRLVWIQQNVVEKDEDVDMLEAKVAGLKVDSEKKATDLLNQTFHEGR
jgi:hypothetical protein